MANAEHLEILKKGVVFWNEWRESNAGEIPNLRKAYLPGLNLREANLRGAILTDADLTQANLKGANLDGTYLAGAYLTDANLNDANLNGACMIAAYLRGAEFIGADLHHADLSGALLFESTLVDSNLEEADLSGATIRGGRLKNVNFSRCKLSNTIFANTDLSECTGFESIRVGSESTIDFKTLRISKNLPKSFWLKIGLPEVFINHLTDLRDSASTPYYPVFLSHSWTNKPFARKLYEALIAKGVNVFFDEKKMKPGDDIFASTSRGIELYDKTILVCSEDSLNSWWVDQELELVFEKERKLQKEVGEKIGLLIPIRIDDHIDTWENGKRMAIKQRIIGDFRNWQDDTAFEKALNDLIHALNADRPEIKPVSHLPGKPRP